MGRYTNSKIIQGLQPKKETRRLAGFGQRRTKQRNLHHPDEHGEFSHLLTSINWWSSKKVKTTHINIQIRRKG